MSRAIEWILLGAGSCAAVLIGLWWRRPARVGPWLLLAGALGSLALGDVVYAFTSEDAAEPFYLAMFVLVAAALVQFTRGGSVLDNRARLIDLLACICSTLLVVWVFVIGDNGQVGKISAADVIGDLLLVCVALRLNLATGRNVSAILLLTGSVGMLAGDILFPMHPSGLTEAGFVVLYVAWGLAALHPSMTTLTEPISPRPTEWRGRWTFLLGASVATPPTVLLIEALNGTVKDGVVIAVAGAITLLLTITRLADSLSLSNQALIRERALRSASATLVSAADPPEVEVAVQATVAQLVPTNSVARVRLATDNRQLALEALPQAPSGPRARSWWVDDQPVTSGDSTATVIDVDDPSAAPSPSWMSRLTSLARALSALRPARADSPAPAVRALAEATLVCPLWLEPLAVARPSGGALILTGRRDVLTTARDTLEVLASQAALALDRISLVEAVGRRDSDLYLRAVIRNTADLMLVVDEDRRIRYASPALHDLIGEPDLSPLATFEDLVHNDDRSEIRAAFSSEGDGTFFCALRKVDQSQVLVEATYRDLRDDRLVQGFVVTMRNVTLPTTDPTDPHPRQSPMDELPAWINRRSAQHKFRY